MKKIYIVTETITQTTTTEYEVEAESEEEARKIFRSQGQYLGDCSGGGKDGIKVREVKS